MNNDGAVDAFDMFYLDEVIKVGINEDFEYAVANGNCAKISGYNSSNVNVSIPARIGCYTVTNIDNYAFKNNTFIKTVTLSTGIKTINYGAFLNCTALETVVHFAEQTVVFVVDAGLVDEVALDIVDALKQLSVKHYPVAVLAERRSHLLRQSLQIVACAGADEVAHHRLHAGEQFAATLQGQQRVFEGRLVIISDDSLYLGILAPHTLLEDGLEVLLLNQIEGSGAVRRVEGKEERVCSHLLGRLVVWLFGRLVVVMMPFEAQI